MNNLLMNLLSNLLFQTQQMIAYDIPLYSAPRNNQNTGSLFIKAVISDYISANIGKILANISMLISKVRTKQIINIERKEQILSTKKMSTPT